MSLFKEKYYKDIIPYFLTHRSFSNKLSIPSISKVVLNMGFNTVKIKKELFEIFKNNLTNIAGQCSVFTKSKKSISNFKLRQGDIVGCKVTLRNDRMYEFLDRFLFIAIPRIRDFRGFSKNSFDKFGNFTIGIHDYSIFPEIEYEKIEHSIGLDVVIAIKTKSKDDAVALLECFEFPFRK